MCRPIRGLFVFFCLFQGLTPNAIYLGSGRGASRPVEMLKALAIHRRARALPLKSSWFVPK